MSSQKIVRDLNLMESLMVQMHGRNQFKNPRAFIIDSKIDLFENQDDVRKAIGIWKRLHPLLQSRIVEVKSDDGQTNYVYEIDEKSVDDVLFLNYKSNEPVVPWTHLMEYENAHMFNLSKLWRIKFVRGQDESKYCLIANFHHVITDGTNAYHIILELLQIIEDVHYNNRQNTSGLSVHEYEYGYPNDPRQAVQLPEDFHNTVTKDELIIDVVTPDCFKPTDDERLNYCVIDSDGAFVSTDGSFSISVKDIIENRIHNVSRFKTFEITKELLGRVMRKAKENGARCEKCFRNSEF